MERPLLLRSAENACAVGCHIRLIATQRRTPPRHSFAFRREPGNGAFRWKTRSRDLGCCPVSDRAAGGMHQNRRGGPMASSASGGLVAVAMTEDVKWCLIGGYCYSLRQAGPFVIGEDFEAPGPAGRILPRISIEQGRWDKLWSFIANGTNIKADESSDAGIFDDAMKRVE